MSWRRSPRVRTCGYCGKGIAVGEPIEELTVFKKIRCRDCASEPTPRDLPPLVERPSTSMTPLVHVASGAGTLPLDWKARAIAEREPGEDDV